ncbi:MAG TPA: hypothetical protein PLC93_10125, partial [Rhodocyclaceae bacterium]|nr:hypothetical protein [Rhodocyclaceae bacterium]
MIAGPATPAARLAARPLFGTLAPWLAALPGDGPPSLEQLRRWLDTAVPRPASGGGVPLRATNARLFMGGGGGGGSNNNNPGNAGARGGGIVILTAGSIT